MSKASIACGMVVALSILILAGCSKDDSTNSNNQNLNRIALQPLRFPTLKSGLVYEGWVVKVDKDSKWLSYQGFGKFFWDEYNYRFLRPDDTTATGYIDSVFAVNGNIYDYNLIAITLEKYPDDNSADPSPTIVAQGEIAPDKATIMEFPAKFGSDTKGMFTIGTFSDGNYKELGQPRESEEYGIWFMQDSITNSKMDTLENYIQGAFLPMLPDTGYTYEGWVSVNVSADSVLTISTGKFYLPDIRDYDNRHCSTGGIPNFPGEDFLLNQPSDVSFPLKLVSEFGGKAFITIEPNPDNNVEKPTNLVVLSGNLPNQEFGVRKTAYEMGNEAALSFPKINVYFFQGK